MTDIQPSTASGQTEKITWEYKTPAGPDEQSIEVCDNVYKPVYWPGSQNACELIGRHGKNEFTIRDEDGKMHHVPKEYVCVSDLPYVSRTSLPSPHQTSSAPGSAIPPMPVSAHVLTSMIPCLPNVGIEQDSTQVLEVMDTLRGYDATELTNSDFNRLLQGANGDGSGTVMFHPHIFFADRHFGWFCHYWLDAMCYRRTIECMFVAGEPTLRASCKTYVLREDEFCLTCELGYDQFKADMCSEQSPVQAADAKWTFDVIEGYTTSVIESANERLSNEKLPRYLLWSGEVQDNSMWNGFAEFLAAVGLTQPPVQNDAAILSPDEPAINLFQMMMYDGTKKMFTGRLDSDDGEMIDLPLERVIQHYVNAGAQEFLSRLYNEHMRGMQRFCYTPDKARRAAKGSEGNSTSAPTSGRLDSSALDKSGAMKTYRSETKMKLLCYRPDEETFEVTDNLKGNGFGWMPDKEKVSKGYSSSFLTVAKKCPNWWLPLDKGVVHKLQLCSGIWYGILQGGRRMKLPFAYVKWAWKKKTWEAANLTDGCGKPVDVCNVGASVFSSSLGKLDLASASAAVGVGAPKVHFPQKDKDFCVTYCAASAVFCTDEESAHKIAGLAKESLKQKDRVKWVQTRCLEMLQPMWKVNRFKNAQLLDVESLLSHLSADGVVSVIQITDQEDNPEHCVAVYGGWLFDSNKSHAIPLSADGLDACCLDKSKFKRAHYMFQLAPGTPKRKRCQDEAPTKKPKFLPSIYKLE